MRPACVSPLLAALASGLLLCAAPVASAEPASSDDRPCTGNVADEPYAGPPPGASTTGLGPLPAAYELRAPAGRPRGVVMTIHGGGWIDVGRSRLSHTAQEVSWWLSQGWAVANVGYRACAASLPDVLEAFDAVRDAVGPGTPVVVAGESAGAHLALMIDARRDDVDVVVAKVGPTNAATLAEGRAYDPERGDMSSTLPALLADVWRRAFGPSWIAETSPVQQAASIGSRVVYARPTHDPIIAEEQGPQLVEALRTAHPDGWVRALELESEPGEVWFSHALVSHAAEDRFRQLELEAVAPWQTGPSAAPVAVAGWWDAMAPVDGTSAPGSSDGTSASRTSDGAPTPWSPSPVLPAGPFAAGTATAPRPAAAAPKTRRLTAAEIRGVAHGAVRARFRHRRTPDRFRVLCRRRTASTSRCTVSWSSARWRYRGTVDVRTARTPTPRTTLRVVRTDAAGHRRVFRST